MTPIRVALFRLRALFRRKHKDFGALNAGNEQGRNARGTGFTETTLQDARYGLRQLRRNPGFTTVAVLTLALGMGGSVAVFSLLETVLLRPLPYSHPERLYRLFPFEKTPGRAMEATSFPNFADWRHESRTFASMAAYEEDSFNLTGTQEPERLDGLRSTPGLFTLLGISPVLGREFSPIDDPHVALLGYELWRRRFAGDAGVIGKSIHLDGVAYAVLGVLPPHFRFPPDRWGSPPEVFLPVIPSPQRGLHYVRVIGRLAPGTTAPQAQAEMSGITARLAQTYAGSNHDRGAVLDQLAPSAVAGARHTVGVLFGAVAFVLLIACTNVANLLLSRSAAREREISIRTAMGATRARLVRQLLTESLLLAGVGAILAVALAYWAFPLLGAALPRHSIFFTRVQDAGFELNSTVLIFTGLLAALSCSLFGLLPAWRSTQPARSSAIAARTGRIRSAMIGLEVALSFILLAGAGLMMKSLVRLLATDAGFRTERLLTMDVSLSESKYATPEKQAAYFDQVLQHLAALPAVLAAGAASDLPLTRNWRRDAFEIPGPHPSEGLALYHAASPDYFRTLGVPLLSGRELTPADTPHAPLVGVINRRMAQKYWPGESPVGKTIVAYRAVTVSTASGFRLEFKPQELEIVGIAGDVRHAGLDALPEPELFVPLAQWTSSEMALVVRTTSQPSSLIPAVRKEIWRVDPDQPVTDIKTMAELVSTEAAGRRFVLDLIGAFAAIALVLAAVGIYGVVSYAMRQRTQEIGIRLALGARRRQILGLAARQNAPWLTLGIATGVGGALALMRLLAAYLYAVRPADPLTFSATAALLLAVAVFAVYIPARRATRVDPLVALRHE